VEETVEAHLFTALKKIFLIDPDGNMFKCKYTRCGRTDKGVSALGNVCALFVRKLKDGDYTKRLNRVLPEDIRILGHAEVSPSFDARLSCIYREYNYFFFAEKMDI
jgi:tRNA pseudouridine38/39 synthase